MLLRNVTLAGGSGSSEVLDVADSQGLYLEGVIVTGRAVHHESGSLPRMHATAGVSKPAAIAKLDIGQLLTMPSQRVFGFAGGYFAGTLLTNVQYGHVQQSRLASADNCLIVRGGCAYLLLNANDVSLCATAGMVLGDTTAFQTTNWPWAQYEIYAVRATNNVIRNVNGEPFCSRAHLLDDTVRIM